MRSSTALIEAANDAGGKDNVTVVYVEGELFAAGVRGGELWTVVDEPDTSVEVVRTQLTGEAPRTSGAGKRHRWRQIRRVALVALLTLVAGYAAYRADVLKLLAPPRTIAIAPNAGGQVVVTPSESIAAALATAPPGAAVVVEPGEYRERLVLTQRRAGRQPRSPWSDDPSSEHRLGRRPRHRRRRRVGCGTGRIPHRRGRRDAARDGASSPGTPTSPSWMWRSLVRPTSPST